ncbi:MAG: hypothetical protein M0D55_05935 [Elusimicrobiota bacterium]|nr:MAG: hypothetical protein M0D55_05935 [Elusimicrobiota bacterium]
MSGSWSDGVHSYKASLSVSVFRPRLANFIQIRNSATGQLVWEKRISELFRLAYRAGEPVTLAGRPYRLFYSEKPTLGLCFIYDDTSAGGTSTSSTWCPCPRSWGPLLPLIRCTGRRRAPARHPRPLGPPDHALTVGGLDRGAKIG